MMCIKFLKYGACATMAALLIATGLLCWSGLHDDIQHADVALVLGNTVNADGTPSPRLKARLDRTLELYRQRIFPEVIVSGGIEKEGHDEAAVMKAYLVAGGIPGGQIIEDHAGVNTYASAKNTLRILREQKLHSVIVITQYFHIPRTKLALKKFGIATVYSAHAHYFEMRDLYSIARELAGLVEYEFKRY